MTAVLLLVFVLSLFLLAATRDLIVLSKRNRYAFAQTVTATIVAYLEQASAWDDTLLDGVARKERSILLLTQWAEANRLSFTFEEMDRLIEQAVLSLPYEIDHAPDGTSGWYGNQAQ